MNHEAIALESKTDGLIAALAGSLGTIRQTFVMAGAGMAICFGLLAAEPLAAPSTDPTLSHTSSWSGVRNAVIGTAHADNHWAFVDVERSRMLPRRGQSSAKVQNQFGEPLRRKGAVGSPPISSWVYSDFTVYFEHNLVITTVASKDNLPARLGDIQ